MITDNFYKHPGIMQGKTEITGTFRSPREQRGVALVMVLWLLILMTVIAASHAKVIRTETRLAANHVEAGKARGLAEAGVYHAIMELMVADDKQRWPVNGLIQRIEYDNGKAAIAIRDARGLLDINRAGAAVLDKVLAGAGLTDNEQRQSLVDAILDWRDRDSLKHTYGAEDEDYRQAGRPWSARDDNFSSVEEFRYVLGMNNTLFERLAPYLTVYSGQPAVRMDYAPQWLVNVLSAAGDTTTTGSTAISTAGQKFHISVRATTSAGSTASLDTVVHIKPDSVQDYAILSWRSPSRTIIPGSG